MNHPGVLKDTERKHRAFSTGSQYADWNSRNCDSCKKGFDKRHSKFRCDYEFALGVAFCGDGLITEEVARAIGFLDSEGCDIWECPGWERGRK